MMDREAFLRHAAKIDYSLQLTDVQQVFLQNYLKCFGNISQACMLTNIANSTYYHWIKNSVEFRRMIQEEYTIEVLSNMRLDFVESKLMKRIDAGDTKAIIYFLRTKGKERGWNEKQDNNKKLDKSTKPVWFDEAINLDAIQEAEVVEEPKQLEAHKPEEPLPSKTKAHGQPNPNGRKPNLSTKDILKLRAGKNQAGSEQPGTGRNGDPDTGSGTGRPETNAGTNPDELNGN